MTDGSTGVSESAAADLPSRSSGHADKSPGISNPLVQSTPVLFTTTADILRQLQRVPDEADFAPYEAALRAAIEQREAIVPELIAALDRVSADPGHFLKHADECLHLFALHLLAQFRETRALDAFLRFFSLPEETALDLTGDVVTEQGAAMLASVCGGDHAPLLRLAHDESVNEFVRDAAIHGLLVQAGWGERPLPAVIEDLRHLFETMPKPGDGYLWACLVGLVCDLVPELAAEARQAFADKLVDTSSIDLTYFENALASTEPYRGRSQAERFKDFLERNAPIDAVTDCSSCLGFRRDDDDFLVGEDPEEDGFSEVDLVDDAAPNSPQRTWTRAIPYVAPPKVGRNEPCPCGSGRKFKKCCGAT